MATNIYALRLQRGKYYIGKSRDIKKRFLDHVSGTGSTWTKKYPPIEIDMEIHNVSPFEEDKITKEYMNKYGINNVRGGSYVTDILSDEQINSLNSEIWSATGKCTRCGRNNHFVSNCFANTTVNGDNIVEYVWECDRCNKEFDTEESCSKHEKFCRIVHCFKCGKPGHYANTCYKNKWY